VKAALRKKPKEAQWAKSSCAVAKKQPQSCFDVMVKQAYPGVTEVTAGIPRLWPPSEPGANTRTRPIQQNWMWRSLFKGIMGRAKIFARPNLLC
jgi:hypothetical protein